MSSNVSHQSKQTIDQNNIIHNKFTAKTSNKNNNNSDNNVRSKSSGGNKQQFKPKTTKKSIGPFKKAQSNGNNQNFKGRQYQPKNTNVPCDSDVVESSEENKSCDLKKSDSASKNELRKLVNRQQTVNKGKSNQFANNRNQVKSTTEKNTKQVIPVNFGKKVVQKKPEADKDCNSKELVQEMKKQNVVNKGDNKKKYETQSKKFVEQNNIEKEICTNNANDSKQPGNL